jgi:hypothetical protein
MPVLRNCVRFGRMPTAEVWINVWQVFASDDIRGTIRKGEGMSTEAIQDCQQRANGAICLFHVGDFYEAFFDDAVYCAKALGLTLTTRDKGEPSVPMTGFPYHQIDAYVAKLVSGGRKVAICEQVQ